MLSFAASPNFFEIAGLSIPRAQPASVFQSVLGPPDRIVEPGKPAPAGHRNNQIHIYDELGVYIIEHHFTYLLESVNFVLDPRHAVFPTQKPFSGTLSIGDLKISAPFHERELKRTGFQLERLFRDWTILPETHAIGFDCKRQIVHSVSVCLSYDPYDESHRPV